VQPDLNGELFDSTFDFSTNFNNSKNQWYWSGSGDWDKKPYNTNHNLNYNTDISCPFFMKEGPDSNYNITTQNLSITISFDSFVYKRLPIQLKPWRDCRITTTISCEGIRALSNMFNTSYDSYCSENNKYTNCTNFNNFPLLQHIDMLYLKTNLQDSSLNYNRESINITVSNDIDISYIRLDLNNKREFRIYDWSYVYNHVYKTYDTSQTILDKSGNTYLNFFELMRYFNDSYKILNDLCLQTSPSKKADKIIILYDKLDNKTPKPLDYPYEPFDTSFIQPNYNTFHKINRIHDIPNFYNQNNPNILQHNILNRYAVAWSIVSQNEVSSVLFSNNTTELKFKYITHDLSVDDISIKFQKDPTNPTNALMNWYDPSNSFNQQYKLKKINNSFSSLYWPGKLAKLNINNKCKPFEENYYNNRNIRKTKDQIFNKNENIHILNTWKMQLFKQDPISSTYISCIIPKYSDISSLYLVSAKNHFFICQEISKNLYPLVVYADGSNLADVMLFKHSHGLSYEWYNQGLDNSYTPFTKNNNLGTVFSWFFGADSSDNVKNILTHILLDISDNIIATYDNQFQSDLSLVGFSDSSCNLSKTTLNTDCSKLVNYLSNELNKSETKSYRFQYYKRYSERASMTISGLNNFMRYINPDIIHISGDCNDTRCTNYSNKDLSNNHNLLYYTTFSGDLNYTGIKPSYTYFETVSWFKFNCAFYQDISNYIASKYQSKYNEIYKQTHARTTWIYITPLEDSTITTHTQKISSNIINIPANYMFELDNTSQNIIIDDYYNQFDSIFNESRKPKLLSKTIESNFISPLYSSQYMNNLYTSDNYLANNTLPALHPSSPTPSSPFINYWGAANCPFSFSTTGIYTVENQKTIMSNAAIVIDGKYRENLMDEGIYNYIEKYTRTAGGAKDGLYCYNFKLDTNPMLIQPTGAMNTNKFTKIELEITTMTPPLNDNKNYQTLCAADGTPIGTTVKNNNTFKYNYDIVFMEERYNIVEFIGGNVGLAFSN